MSMYRICPDCGAHLDPGERCDCRDATAAPDKPFPIILPRDPMQASAPDPRDTG